MLHSPVDAIIFGLSSSKALLHRMLADLKSEDFHKQPCEGANCIAWILGHLTLVDRRTLNWIGVTDLPPLPEGYEALFATTRTVAAQQGGFPESQDLILLLDQHRDQVIASLPKFDLARLNEPTPIERPMFRTYGEYLLFMGLHTSLHIGQISTIRRVLGYPPLS